MQRSDKDKVKEKDAKAASRLELKGRARRTREREAASRDVVEQPTAPPSAIKIVDDRLEK